jgi:hypothetical protein
LNLAFIGRQEFSLPYPQARRQIQTSSEELYNNIIKRTSLSASISSSLLLVRREELSLYLRAAQQPS